MAYQLIEERLISGVGLIRIPQERRWRDYILFIDTVRKPSSEFLNFDWFPPKGLYGRAVTRYQGSVLESFLIEFDSYVYRSVQDISAQNLIAINCGYIGTLQSIANLATCIIECTPINIVNNVEEMRPLQLSPDEVIVNCQSNAALRLQLYGQTYVQCGEERIRRPSPPPTPDPPTPVPPGQPIDFITPPYDSDDDVTEPDPLDEGDDPTEPDFPVGEDCEIFEVTLLWATPIDPPGNTIVGRFFGPIQDVIFRDSTGGSEAVVVCRGAQFQPLDECQPDIQEVQFASIANVQLTDIDTGVISITPA